jgi:hypothetical protein
MKIAPLADVNAHFSAYVDECKNQGPVIPPHYYAQR